jgi:hypothetical protein
MLSIGGGGKQKKLYQKILDEKQEALDIAFNFHLNALAQENLYSLIKALYFVDEEIENISSWLYGKTKGKMYWVSVCL